MNFIYQFSFAPVQIPLVICCPVIDTTTYEFDLS